MSAPGPADPQSAAGAQAKLRELADALRRADHLGPEAQGSLADLVDELSRALPAASLPAADAAHLKESAAHLARAVHDQHDTSLLTGARERLEHAAYRAEASAPFLAGILRRLIDTLANLGI
jgi:hypothetical protein